MTRRECMSQSPDATQDWAQDFAQQLQPGDVVTLAGPLGAGKTCFVQGLAAGLGVPASVFVNSPSYVLMNVYEGGRVPIYHFDWYRLEQESALHGLDLPEYFDGDGVTVVEWAEKFPAMVPTRAHRIQIDVLGATERRIVCA